MLWTVSRRTGLLVGMLALVLAGGLQTEVPRPHPGAGPERAMKAQVQAAFGQLPLYFIENRGQVDTRVAYYVQGRDTTLYFTAQGITFALTGPGTRPPASDTPVARVAWRPGAVRPTSAPEAPRQRWAVKLDFVGANPDVQPTGQDPTPAVVSYFKGPRSQWQTGLPTYATLVYADLWPGIDLIYTGTVNRLKATFVVKPGADPSQIQLAYRGATAVTLTEAGQLDVQTPVGSFSDEKPYVYQERAGRRVAVPVAYTLDGDGAAGPSVYGFRVGAYDTSQPLVVDPVILLYAGYIGGSGGDWGYGIAVDDEGNAYVTGFTASTEATFPVTVGPDLTFNGGWEAFVAKVNAAGTALVYAGYLGGSGDDWAYGIAVDGEGNAYVTGWTRSTEATFPVTGGPDLTFNGGAHDAFVAKVNAAGTALVYAGYLGGSGDDFGNGIAVDGEGNAYVTGETGSDAFVAKVRADGSGLVYARYIGGSWGRGIAVDGEGNAYVTGETASTEATFPVTVGPDLTFNGGGHDAFVAKVNAAGTALVYAGYIGGSGDDWSFGIAVDGEGNAYVTGRTSSSEATFPVTVGPDLTYNGGWDAFVAKVNAAGTAVVYAGYIGGSTHENEFLGLVFSHGGIAVDGEGNAYVTGGTGSDEATFPVTLGPDLTYNGGGDAFVAKVNAAGTALVYAGYLGGSGDDWGFGIAVDATGNAYITGWTGSTEATFPETVGPDLTHNGGFDAFVAKIADTAAIGADLALTKTDSPDPVTVGNHLEYTITVTNNGPDLATGVTLTDTLPAGVTFVSATPPCTQAGGIVTCNLGTLASGANAPVTIVVTPTAPGTITNTAEVTGNEPDPDPTNNTATAVTTVNQGGICPATAALEGAPQREAKLGVLYAFRDEVLANTPTGQRYIDLFYKHAVEGVWLMVRYPELRVRTRALLERFLPMLQAILAGKPATMTPADLVTIDALLEAFAAKASSELQADLKAIQAELRQGTLLEQSGIRLRGKRLTPSSKDNTHKWRVNGEHTQTRKPLIPPGPRSLTPVPTSATVPLSPLEGSKEARPRSMGPSLPNPIGNPGDGSPKGGLTFPLLVEPLEEGLVAHVDGLGDLEALDQGEPDLFGQFAPGRGVQLLPAPEEGLDQGRFLLREHPAFKDPLPQGLLRRDPEAWTFQGNGLSSLLDDDGPRREVPEPFRPAVQQHDDDTYSVEPWEPVHDPEEVPDHRLDEADGATILPDHPDPHPSLPRGLSVPDRLEEDEVSPGHKEVQEDHDGQGPEDELLLGGRRQGLEEGLRKGRQNQKDPGQEEDEEDPSLDGEVHDEGQEPVPGPCQDEVHADPLRRRDGKLLIHNIQLDSSSPWPSPLKRRGNPPSPCKGERRGEGFEMRSMERDRFIEERQGAWEALGRLLDAAEKRGLQRLKGEDLRTLGRLYRQAASDLALAQSSAGDPKVVRFLNDLVARAHGQIYRTKRSRLQGIGTFYLETFPLLFRETLPSTFIAFSAFLLPALLGFLQASLDPPFTDFFVPPPLKESLERGELWVSSINTMKPLATSRIMTNNLSVTFVAFALGMTFGVGTLYIMVVNGVLLGVTAALVAQYGRSLEFWAFVLPHGVLELSAIFIAGGAGCLLASALLFPGDFTRRDALVLKGHQAIRLILGCLPLLIGAGIIEGFVSPSPLPPLAKLALASSLALLLFLYLTSGHHPHPSPP